MLWMAWYCLYDVIEALTYCKFYVRFYACRALGIDILWKNMLLKKIMYCMCGLLILLLYFLPKNIYPSISVWVCSKDIYYDIYPFYGGYGCA